MFRRQLEETGQLRTGSKQSAQLTFGLKFVTIVENLIFVQNTVLEGEVKTLCATVVWLELGVFG